MSETQHLQDPNDPHFEGRVRKALHKLFSKEQSSTTEDIQDGSGSVEEGDQGDGVIIDGKGSLEEGDQGDGVIVDGYEPPEPPDSLDVDDDASA